MQRYYPGPNAKSVTGPQPTMCHLNNTGFLLYGRGAIGPVAYIAKRGPLAKMLFVSYSTFQHTWAISTQCYNTSVPLKYVHTNFLWVSSGLGGTVTCGHCIAMTIKITARYYCGNLASTDSVRPFRIHTVGGMLHYMLCYSPLETLLPMSMTELCNCMAYSCIQLEILPEY